MLRTRNRLDVLLHACLAAQQPCVADNTNVTASQRGYYRGLAKAAGFRVIAYYFDLPTDAAIIRNAARLGPARVPDLAVRGTAAKLQPLVAAEGFDAAYRVTEDGVGGFVVEEVAS